MIADGSETERGRGACRMRDLISDWKRWSRAERCAAIVLVILSLALPVGLVLAGGKIGS